MVTTAHPDEGHIESPQARIEERSDEDKAFTRTSQCFAIGVLVGIGVLALIFVLMPF